MPNFAEAWWMSVSCSACAMLSLFVILVLAMGVLLLRNSANAAPTDFLNRAVALTNVTPKQTVLKTPRLTGNLHNTVSMRAGALVTLYAADQKKFLTVPGECTGHPDAWFKEKDVHVLSMGKTGPRFICTGNDPKGNLFVIISEQNIANSIYKCTTMQQKQGCERASFWWSVWYKWNSQLELMGITAEDIRLNRRVFLTPTKYAYMVRLFWRAFHDGSLPKESTAVHSIHGHYIPKVRLRAPLMSKGGGAFGAPIWHQYEDPCVNDTMAILFKYKNIIARPCKPIIYDGSGFYVSYPDRLSSTVLANCDHTCGFRYYHGSSTRGQIVAYDSWKSTLKMRKKIEGAVLDGQ